MHRFGTIAAPDLCDCYGQRDCSSTRKVSPGQEGGAHATLPSLFSNFNARMTSSCGSPSRSASRRQVVCSHVLAQHAASDCTLSPCPARCLCSLARISLRMLSRHVHKTSRRCASCNGQRHTRPLDIFARIQVVHGHGLARQACVDNVQDGVRPHSQRLSCDEAALLLFLRRQPERLLRLHKAFADQRAPFAVQSPCIRLT